MNRFPMKRVWRLGLWSVLVMCFLHTTSAEAASGPVTTDKASVYVNGKTFIFDYVTVDLTDPHVRVAPVEAQGGIGHVESFQSIIDRTGAAAAVNGTFFDAYVKDDTQRFPNGLMIRDGAVIRSGENQSFVLRTDKTPDILKAKLQMQLTVTQPGVGKSYTFTPWAVNVYYGAGVSGQIGLFTQEYGTSIAFPNGTHVVVDGGHIKQVSKSGVSVPANGYVIFIEGVNQYVLPEMNVGAAVEMKTTFAAGSAAYTANDWMAAIGVGPKLISDGKIDIDTARDGFSDPKITTNAGIRSFVGIDKRNRLVMGDFPSATIREMAQALQLLGLTEAMNMDGGASSGLYANGSMIRTPGRELSNALIVQVFDEEQVQVVVNGQFVNEFRGYIDNDTTMVPFRGIFSRIGAKFVWFPDSEQITAEKNGVKLMLNIGDRKALVNGKSVTMPKAPILRDGFTYIPLRFITETLGAKVDWDSDLFRATIKM